MHLGISKKSLKYYIEIYKVITIFSAQPQNGNFESRYIAQRIVRFCAAREYKRKKYNEGFIPAFFNPPSYILC
jgi:hypothetical protein